MLTMQQLCSSIIACVCSALPCASVFMYKILHIHFEKFPSIFLNVTLHYVRKRNEEIMRVCEKNGKNNNGLDSNKHASFIAFDCVAVYFHCMVSAICACYLVERGTHWRQESEQDMYCISIIGTSIESCKHTNLFYKKKRRKRVIIVINGEWWCDVRP